MQVQPGAQTGFHPFIIMRAQMSSGRRLGDESNQLTLAIHPRRAPVLHPVPPVPRDAGLELSLAGLIHERSRLWPMRDGDGANSELSQARWSIGNLPRLCSAGVKSPTWCLGPAHRADAQATSALQRPACRSAKLKDCCREISHRRHWTEKAAQVRMTASS